MTTTCGICDATNIGFAWTDTHGVAQCTTCGSPYRLFHYNEQEERVEKSPELLVDDQYIALLRRYWNEAHRRIPSGCSFPGGYELATAEESRLFHEWARANFPNKSAEPVEVE